MIKLDGWDHKYSIAEREKKMREMESNLKGDYVYLQTCNRVELYNGDDSASQEIIEHLFRVVSGLKSKMVGEAHIQGQVKRAYMEARENEHINSGLHRLFQFALRCGKRVRSETAISTGAVSHSHAAVIALKNWNCEGHSLPILIIGVNELTQKIVTFLNHQSTTDITVTNRTLSKISQMNWAVDVKSFPLEELSSKIDNYSIVISATSSKDLIVDSGWFDPQKERLLIDLAVPRDIDPKATEFPNTTLHTVEDLEELVSHSIEKRKNEIDDAEVIIAEEIFNYYDSIEKGKKYAKNS